MNMVALVVAVAALLPLMVLAPPVVLEALPVAEGVAAARLAEARRPTAELVLRVSAEYGPGKRTDSLDHYSLADERTWRLETAAGDSSRRGAAILHGPS